MNSDLGVPSSLVPGIRKRELVCGPGGYLRAPADEAAEGFENPGLLAFVARKSLATSGFDRLSASPGVSWPLPTIANHASIRIQNIVPVLTTRMHGLAIPPGRLSHHFHQQRFHVHLGKPLGGRRSACSGVAPSEGACVE